MKSADRTAKPASTPRMDRFAMLCGGLRCGGSGASSFRAPGVFVLVLATIVSSVCLSAPAFAARPVREYVFDGTFGSEGSGAGQLSEPQGVAVDDATGDVYVVDTNNDRVEVFSSTGAFEGQFDGSGTYEVKGQVETGTAAGFGGNPGEVETGKFSGPRHIAVDNDQASPSYGDVYVTDDNHHVVDKFSATGAYIGQIGEPENGVALGGVAVDTQGQLWIAGVIGVNGFPFGIVRIFNSEPNNELISSLNYGSGCASGEPIAVGTDNTFYTVSENNGGDAICQYNASGESTTNHFGVFDEQAAQGATGITVDSATNNLLVVNAYNSGGVAEFSSADELVATFGHEQIGSFPKGGIAINASTGAVFVTNPQGGDVAAFILAPPSKPVVETTSVSKVTADSATLQGEVNLHGANTQYYFEYGPCVTPASCSTSPYGQVTPVPAAALESAFAVEAVQEHVQGLTAGTVYHFRLVAVSAEYGTDEGEEQSFKTQIAGALTLPDGREWEMVSPPQKDGALIEPPVGEGGLDQAAAGGGAISYLANRPTESGVTGFANLEQVLSTRGQGGWITHDLGVSHNGAVGQISSEGQEYRFFSEDLSQAVVQPQGPFLPCVSSEGKPQPCLSPEASEQTAFLHTDFLSGNVEEPCTNSCYRPLVTGCPEASRLCSSAVQEYADVPAGAVFGQRGETGAAAEGRPCPPERHCGPSFEGASPDANHIVFQSRAPLSANYPNTAGVELYEWNAGKPADEQLAPISVEPAREGKPEELTPEQGYLGSAGGTQARGAVSDDGSRVFWTDASRHLYMRDTVKQDTIQIGGNGEAEAAPQFQFASSGGSRVFYSESSGLYECEIREGADGKLECEPSRLGEPRGAVIGGSEDGSYIYFVSQNLNLTMDHYDGMKWTSKVIATLSSKDSPDSGFPQLTARVSPDGRWLAFMSSEPLTGYDNRDAASGNQDEELFLYDSVTGRLSCASCDPTGARPTGVEYGNGYAGENELVRGERVWENNQWLAADVPAWYAYESGYALYQPRYLSDEGRLFFDSYGALVPKDVDGTWDVYEYEPEGVGSEAARCGPAAGSGSVVFKPGHVFDVGGVRGEEGAGCVGLISSGTSAQESAFLDASESGGDVFFLTTSKLSTTDFDTSYDVYDAHECTSASPCAAQQQSPPPECTTAEECRAAPTPEPSLYGAPASATFNGLGNLTPTVPAVKPAVKKATVKCPKSKVRKHDKCIRKSKLKKKAGTKKTNRRAGR